MWGACSCDGWWSGDFTARVIKTNLDNFTSDSICTTDQAKGGCEVLKIQYILRIKWIQANTTVSENLLITS